MSLSPGNSGVERIEFGFSDPAVFYDEDQPLRGRIQQIGRGGFAGRGIGLCTDELEVWLYTVNRECRATCALESDDLLLSTVVRTDGPVFHNGRALGPADVVEYRRDHENTQTVAPGTYLDVRCRADVAERAGWRGGGETYRDAAGDEFHKLAALCDASLDGSAGNDGEDDLVRTAVSAVAASPATVASARPASHRNHHLLTRAIELIEAALDGEPLGVPRLADLLGVSERTVYRAFKHELGTSPYDYLLARRLNRVRRVLLGSMPTSGAVTRAAAAAGFDHFSDMARMYKRLFGETPRQTLRRSGKWSI